MILPGTAHEPLRDTRLPALRARLEVVAAGLKGLPLVVLVLVAHDDDEAIGPGATLATLALGSAAGIVLAVVAADNPVRRAETLRAAELLGLPAGGVILLDFPDGDLDGHARAVHETLATFDQVLAPDVVVTHAADDHPDHALLYALSRRVFGLGGSTLLHFRIPQATCSPWHPTVFFRVTEPAARLKLGELCAVYSTENWKSLYFDPVRNAGVLSDAGYCAGSPYAEPFEATVLRLQTHPCGAGAPVLARNDTRCAGGGEPTSGNPGGAGLVAGRVVLEPCPCGCGAVAVARRNLPVRPRTRC